MTMAELQKEVSLLPDDAQDTLAAYLTMLRKSRDPKWEEKLSASIEDTDNTQWVDLENLAQG